MKWRNKGRENNVCHSEKLDKKLTATLPWKDTGYSNNPPWHNKRAETALRSYDTFLTPGKQKMQASKKSTPPMFHFFRMTFQASWYVVRLAMNSFYEDHHHHHQMLTTPSVPLHATDTFRGYQGHPLKDVAFSISKDNRRTLPCFWHNINGCQLYDYDVDRIDTSKIWGHKISHACHADVKWNEFAKQMDDVVFFFPRFSSFSRPQAKQGDSPQKPLKGICVAGFANISKNDEPD